MFTSAQMGNREGRFWMDTDTIAMVTVTDRPHVSVEGPVYCGSNDRRTIRRKVRKAFGKSIRFRSA